MKTYEFDTVLIKHPTLDSRQDTEPVAAPSVGPALGHPILDPDGDGCDFA